MPTTVVLAWEYESIPNQAWEGELVEVAGILDLRDEEGHDG